MKRSVIETVMGAAALSVAIFFLFYAFNKTSSGSVSGYQIVAEFDNATGLNVGTDVRLAGVKVGSVVEQSLDKETYYALVTMEIDEGLPLPKGTSARVLSENLLGGSYVSLVPGSDDDSLQSGDVILDTQGAVDIVDLLGRFIFSGGGRI